MTRRSQHFPPELRERAVRMVAEVTPNDDSQLSTSAGSWIWHGTSGRRSERPRSASRVETCSTRSMRSCSAAWATAMGDRGGEGTVSK
jgi:hypothetical protein